MTAAGWCCRKAAVPSTDETQRKLELRVAELEQRLIQVCVCIDVIHCTDLLLFIVAFGALRHAFFKSQQSMQRLSFGDLA